jgi:hypothetical protein
LRYPLGKPSSTKQLYEVRPHSQLKSGAVAGKRRRLRNLSVPTKRLSKTASSTPHGMTESGRRIARGIETSVCSGRLPFTASAQLVCTRSSGRIGWAVGDGSKRLVSQIRSPAWGPIQRQRGQACAAVRRIKGSGPTSCLISRGRRIAPVRRTAPQAGPEFAVRVVAGLWRPPLGLLHSTHQVPFIGSLHR